LGRDRRHPRRRFPDGRAEDAHSRTRRPLTGAGVRQRSTDNTSRSAGATKRAGIANACALRVCVSVAGAVRRARHRPQPRMHNRPSGR
jgi:hypothetical protein